MFTRIKYIVILFWLFVITFAYASLFPLPELLAGLPCISSVKVTGKFLNHLFILLLIVVAANGWGKIFWHNHHILHLEKFLFATGTGLGIISLIVLFAGLVGITGKLFYIALLIAGSLIFILQRLEFHEEVSFHIPKWLLLSALPLAGSLIGALAPPTQFDSLVYHLALPARYLADGGIHAVEHNIFSSFSQNLEMLYMLALSIDSDILANLIHWMFLPLTGLAILAFSHRFWKSSVGLTASTIWLFTPAALFISTGTYVDLGLAFFVFLSFYSAIIALDAGHRKWIYASGFFIGIAMGVKYTAGAAAFIILLIILFWEFPGKSRTVKDNGVNWRWGALFILAAAVMFVPWLLKNTILLGNPAAPWSTGIFKGSLITPDVAARYFEHIRHHGAAIKNLSDLFLLPWKMTAFGFQFGGSFDILGPVFLLFIPALFLQFKIDKIQRIILFFISVFFIFWMAGGKALRFLVPIVPFLSILAAHGFAGFGPARWLKASALALLLFGLMHNILIFHWTMAMIDPYSVVIGSETRAGYLSRKVNCFHALESIHSIPENSKVLFWGETRGYYGPARSIVPTDFDDNPLAVWCNMAGGARSVAAAMKQEKVTHVFVNISETRRLNMDDRLSAPGRSNMSAFFRDFTRLVFQDEYCKVYEIIY